MRRERITITIRSDVLRRLDSIIDGEKIRNRSNAIETVVLEKLRSRVLRTAVIFAVGSQEALIDGKKGSKIFYQIRGKTLMEKNIETLKNMGIDTLIISIGELKNQAEKILGNGSKFGIKIKYVEQFNGTAGVLRDIKKELNETFLAMNGDIFLDKIDLGDMYLFHKKSGGTATLSVATSEDPSQLGNIFIKGNLITDFREKMGEAENQSHLVSGGVYVFEPEIAKHIPSGFQMLENDTFPQLAKDKKLFGYNIGKEWTHLHNEEKLQEFLKKVFRV